eukprot:725749-Pleurochrysis_carterae.AAC.1
MGKIMRNVRAGDREWVTYAVTATAKTKSDRPTLLAAATAWWQERLTFYDMLPAHIRRCMIHPVRKMQKQV